MNNGCLVRCKQKCNDLNTVDYIIDDEDDGRNAFVSLNHTFKIETVKYSYVGSSIRNDDLRTRIYE